ncbi:long-chain fatty acid transporter fat1, variant 2 [Dermatophagoides farinae]|uniref:Long-chain fatty acid transporter fat1, variant 2 n=1 Tax=Dermatophagoides farinae TaxID=6954 RepID=A0A922HV26_DERFA|nr:long-chain fatty acid transporter fat1, variant 2 [Dermatophagoides farinae]
MNHCCRRKPANRTSSTLYHENCDHQSMINNKDNNFEMTNMSNNIAAATINHHHQIKSAAQNYQELYNNNNTDCNSVLNSEDYDQQTPVIGIIDYAQNFKKNAPIASVSPQMIETIRHQSSSSMISINSNKDNKKNKKRSKISASTGNNLENHHYHPHHRKRTSLNDSSDSNDKNSEKNHDDENDVNMMLPSPPLEIKLGTKLEFSRNNYIERYLPKHDDDSNGYRKYSTTTDMIDCDLNSKKLDDNLMNGNNGQQQQQQQKQQHRNRNRNDSSGSIHSSSISQQIKPVTLLTFNRSSLNESADNFSLLTPSSSCSTTPIAALVNSSSTSDTIDQCSSSMSSSSNNDLKTSPMGSSSIAFINGSESSNTIIKNNHYHQYIANNGGQTMDNHQSLPVAATNGNGNHKMTSFSSSYQVKHSQQRSTLNNNIETNGNQMMNKLSKINNENIRYTIFLTPEYQ